MNPKIAQFLAEQQPATPCLLLDLDRVEQNYRALQRVLPLARIYYAVKANPAAPILERLARLGSSFDAAGIEEIEACLAAGARPEAISFGNTIKKSSAIGRAFNAGISFFAFDWPRNCRSSRSMPQDRACIAASMSGMRGPIGLCHANLARP